MIAAPLLTLVVVAAFLVGLFSINFDPMPPRRIGIARVDGGIVVAQSPLTPKGDEAVFDRGLRECGFPFAWHRETFRQLGATIGGQPLTAGEIDALRLLLSQQWRADADMYGYQDAAERLVLQPDMKRARYLPWGIVANAIFYLVGIAWIVVLVLLSRHNGRVARHGRRLAFLQTGQCPRCRYDIRHSDGRCPECGASLDA